MKQRAPAIIFAISYALVINLAKFILTQIYSATAINAGLVLSLINDFTIGFLIFAVTQLLRHQNLGNLLLWSLCLLTVVIEFLAFHYYLVFGRLPGAGILFYVTELQQLQTSFDNNVPGLMLLLEIAVVSSAIFLLYTLVNRLQQDLFQKSTMEFLAIFIVLLSVLIQLFPDSLPPVYKWHARHEGVWLLQSYLVRDKYNLNELVLSSENFDRYLASLGHKIPGPVIDPEYPLCRYQEKQSLQNRRSVILLVLEGVSKNEMRAEYNNQPLMPNLESIAADNFMFENIYAPGSKSAQALTAIFSGLPAQTSYHYLWTKPLINMNGFPNELKKQGYSTAYFHGSDLSFEQQRQYLEKVGFDHLYEYSPEHKHEIYGWGYADEVMFNELQQWIEKTGPDMPYFATLFTISTHDPYLLPDSWQRVFSEETINRRSETNWTLLQDLESIKIAARETYRYLDYQLGQFYQWYLENEKDKGTLLVITGDHGSYLFAEQKDYAAQARQFNVPLIVAGDLKRYDTFLPRDLGRRVGGLNDLPATLMGLLGGSVHICNTGVDLTSVKNGSELGRLVYSVAGDELEEIFLWGQAETLLLDRGQEKLYRIDGEARLELPDNSSNIMLQDLSNLFKVNFFLLKNNSYFPAKNMQVDIEQPSFNASPVFVSHRGNVHGPGNQFSENSRAALEAVVASDFDWVEIDVQLTADGIPVLLHDPFVVFPDSSKQAVIDKTYAELTAIKAYQDLLTLEQALVMYASKLNMLIEVKAPEHISDILHLGREVARLVRTYRNDKKIIVDSFHDELITSIKKQCLCETGLDAPFKAMLDREALEYIKSMNMDWVYLHHSVVTADVLQQAHATGLKVMAYTVNDASVIRRWGMKALPDGIITDDIAIKAVFDQANAAE